MARVLSISTDLMLGSKVTETLTAAGHEVVSSPSLEETTWAGVDLIVADLDVENPEALVGLGMPVLGYYSHVDVETRKPPRRRGSTWRCRARGWPANYPTWWNACSTPSGSSSRPCWRSQPAHSRSTSRLNGRGWRIGSSARSCACCSARSSSGLAASRSPSAPCGLRWTKA